MVFMIVFIVVFLVMAIVMVVSMWKIFEKAGKPGWAAIVPVYNHMVMAEIGGKPNWFGLLPMIPYIGSIWSIWILNRLVKSFNKEVGFTLGLIFLPFIFYPMLAFGSSEYVRHPDDRGQEISNDEVLD
jgi:hypothetical protein